MGFSFWFGYNFILSESFYRPRSLFRLLLLAWLSRAQNHVVQPQRQSFLKLVCSLFLSPVRSRHFPLRHQWRQRLSVILLTGINLCEINLISVSQETETIMDMDHLLTFSVPLIFLAMTNIYCISVSSFSVSSSKCYFLPSFRDGLFWRKKLGEFCINPCVTTFKVQTVAFSVQPWYDKRQIVYYQPFCFQYFFCFGYRLFLCTTRLAGNEKMSFVCRYAIFFFTLFKRKYFFFVF